MSESNDFEIENEYDFSKAVKGHHAQAVEPIDVKINGQNSNREITIKTIELQAIVSKDGKLTIQLPADITPGKHRIVLLIEEAIAGQ